MNTGATDELMAGASVSADSGYWASYLFFVNPATDNTLTLQTFYYPSGQNGIVANPNSGIDPRSWYYIAAGRGCSVPCFGEGDYAGIASNVLESASAPFVLTSSAHTTDLWQTFVQDPQAVSDIPNFTPNFVPIPVGADVTYMGSPVPPSQWAVPPGDKAGPPGQR